MIARILIGLIAATPPALAQEPPAPDATLTYSASCSTFLKTAFEGWARIAGKPQIAALGGDLIGVLSGRAATFDLRGRRVSLSPAISPDGGLLIGGSIQ